MHYVHWYFRLFQADWTIVTLSSTAFQGVTFVYCIRFKMQRHTFLAVYLSMIMSHHYWEMSYTGFQLRRGSTLNSSYCVQMPSWCGTFLPQWDPRASLVVIKSKPVCCTRRPRCAKMEVRLMGFRHSASTVWNSLTTDNRSSQIITSFRSKLNTFLFQLAFSTE